MLSFFKSNNPGVVVFYLAYLLVFRLCYAFIPFDTSFTSNYHEPLSHLLFGFLNAVSLNSPLWSLFLSGVLVFIQALYINRIVNDQRMTAKKNHLGGWLYILLSSFFPQSLLLSPALISVTALIVACEKLFFLIKKEKMTAEIYDLGFLTAIASLFFFPAVAFLIFVIIGLSSVRSFNYKEYTVLTLGLTTPFFLLFTYYFWNDNLTSFLFNLSNHYEKGWLLGFHFSNLEWLLIGSLFSLTLFVLFMVPSVVYSSLIQVRKFVGILMFMIALIVAAFFLQQQIHLSYIVWLAFPISIFLTMLIMQWKRNWIAEIMHIILFLLVLVGQYIPLFFST